MAILRVPRRDVAGMRCRLLGLVTLLCVATRIEAADISWINVSGGTFSTVSNWSDIPLQPDRAPGPNDIAHFGLTANSGFFIQRIYTVSFTTDPTNQALMIEDDFVTFDLNGNVYIATAANPITIGTVSARTGRLTITRGNVAVPSTSTLSIGAGGAGFLTVTTGGLLAGSAMDIFVGRTGNGTLTVNNNGDIIANKVSIGFSFSRTGTATITGAGSVLLTTALNVGEDGTGTLDISDRGTVESSSGTIGKGSGSKGTVNVRDPLSNWDVSGPLIVGGQEPREPSVVAGGTLNITAGGRVDSSFSTIGSHPNSTGTVLVDGTGSTWDVGDELYVGSSGEGTLDIKAGGVVRSKGSLLGIDVGAMGTVTVDGALGNSQWINSGHLFFGDHGGEGVLNIKGGGRVESGLTAVRRGTVKVEGSGSTWITGELGVNGLLNVLDGGRVESQRGGVSSGDASSEGVTVSGRNSQWIISENLTVGFTTGGTLNITDGGLVQDGLALVGDEADGVGVVTVDGPLSNWINSNAVVVGKRGRGTLIIRGGGQVLTLFASIGNFAGSMGTATVDGANSTWSSTADLNVGFQGTATLNITSGGKVTNRSAFVGREVGSTGTVTVASSVPGAGSIWVIDQRLAIGGDALSGDNGGKGTLRIQPGGTVTVLRTHLWDDDNLFLEGGTLSTSEIRFRGPIGFNRFFWTSGTLHVGFFDGASLDVPNGGVLAPGNSAGTTTTRGDYASLSGATTEIEIGGTLQGAQYDFVNVLNNALLVSGNLKLVLLNGFVPNASDTFTILAAAGNITGAYANVANGQRLTTSDGLGSFVVNYGPGSPFNPDHIILTAFFQTGTLPGDYNQNGTVDAADYVVWRNTLGATGTGLAADGNNNGQIDNGDYSVWRAHFGQTGGNGSGANANAVVPEPITSVLVILGATASITFRRARSRRRDSRNNCD